MLDTVAGEMSPLQAALARVAKPAPPPAPVAAPVQPSVRLRDYQEDFVVKVRVAYRSGHRAVLLVAATGAGKCLARGTPVMLHDGTIKPAEEIAVGDLLMGPDSLPRRVETLARGREMMYRVTPTKGDAYTVNESHILSLRNTRGMVTNIEVRDYLAKSLHWRIVNRGWRVPGILSGSLAPELTGITVEPVGEDDYYGFEISGPDRLFLLGDFTVTHNTVVFSYIAKSAAARGKRVLILAHRDQLIKQASKKLTENGVVHGIVMAGFTPQPRRGVQVASVQTLVRRLKAMKEAEAAAAAAARAKALAAGQTEAEADAAGRAAAAALGFDLIVVDEAHLSAAKSYMDILAAWPDALVLGVTGSPIRLDGKGLGRTVGGAYDVIVQGITIRELISRAFLVKPKVYASKMQIDLSGVKKVGGDYDADAMAAIMDKPVITGHAVTEYKRICPGVPAVAWCTNVAHARHVAEEFNAAGVPALALSGENTSEERDRALRMLSDGRLKVITFAMLLVEGVDCPAIGAVIMLRLTMSLSSYLQTIGRGLRPVYAEGMPLDTIEQRFAAIDAGPKGRHCYVIDHVGLWQKHGFADADREWDLLGEMKKKKKKKDEEEKVDLCQCPKCGHVFDPKNEEEQALGRAMHSQAIGAPAPEAGIYCAGCGHRLPVRVRKGPEHVEGELAEITPEMEAALKAKKKDEVRGAKTLEELERIAAQRGYSPGWAKNTFEAKARARAKYTRGSSRP